MLLVVMMMTIPMMVIMVMMMTITKITRMVWMMRMMMRTVTGAAAAGNPSSFTDE